MAISWLGASLARTNYNFAQKNQTKNQTKTVLVPDSKPDSGKKPYSENEKKTRTESTRTKISARTSTKTRESDENSLEMVKQSALSMMSSGVYPTRDAVRDEVGLASSVVTKHMNQLKNSGVVPKKKSEFKGRTMRVVV